jgi:hypothetical protein
MFLGNSGERCEPQTTHHGANCPGRVLRFEVAGGYSGFRDPCQAEEHFFLPWPIPLVSANLFGHSSAKSGPCLLPFPWN